MSSHEFWLTDDAGRRFGLLNNYAFASYSRSTRGYGVVQFGLPLEEWMRVAPIVFQPDWRLDVWRSPAPKFNSRRESSYFLRKYRIYDQVDKGVRMIELFGRCPLDILRRWTVASTDPAKWKMTGKADDLMKAVVKQEFITGGNCVPTGELVVEGDVSLGPVITSSFCGKNVLKVCQDMKADTFSLHETNSSNRRIFFDVVEGGISISGFNYIFRTYADLRGLDRTKDLIFSIENGNLKTPAYEENYLDEETVAQVNDTVVTSPDSKLSRWNSIMGFKSTHASDSDSDTDAANKMLSDKKKKISLDAYFLDSPGSTDQPRSLYGIDWDLGDLLRVQYVGKNMDAEVEIVWIAVDENGHENIVGSNRVGE